MRAWTLAVKRSLSQGAPLSSIAIVVAVVTGFLMGGASYLDVASDRVLRSDLAGVPAQMTRTLESPARTATRDLAGGGQRRRSNRTARRTDGPTTTNARAPCATRAFPRRAGGLSQASCQVLVEGVEELLGGLPFLVRADEQSEVLRHVSGLDRLDHDILEGLRKLGKCRVVVERGAV